MDKESDNCLTTSHEGRERERERWRRGEKEILIGEVDMLYNYGLSKGVDGAIERINTKVLGFCFDVLGVTASLCNLDFMTCGGFVVIQWCIRGFYFIYLFIICLGLIGTLI